MNENKILSSRRMFMLMRDDLITDWRRMLISIGALLAILTTAIIIQDVDYINIIRERNLYDNMQDVWKDNLRTKVTWYIFAFLLSGTFYASQMFRSLSSGKNKVSALMLPASVEEKFLVKWIEAIPMFLIGFFLVAVFADWIRLIILATFYRFSTGAFPFSDILNGSLNLYYPEDFGWLMLTGFLALQSFFFLGAIVWRKLHFIKTIVALVAIIAVYAAFALWIMDVFTSDNVNYYDPEFIRDKQTAYIAYYCLTAVIALFNYTLAFLRLRETDLNNKW